MPTFCACRLLGKNNLRGASTTTLLVCKCYSRHYQYTFGPSAAFLSERGRVNPSHFTAYIICIQQMTMWFYVDQPCLSKNCTFLQIKTRDSHIDLPLLRTPCCDFHIFLLEMRITRASVVGFLSPSLRSYMRCHKSLQRLQQLSWRRL